MTCELCCPIMKTSPLKISIVEHYLKGRGHHAYFLPKFHCEFECAWAQAKVYCHAYTNFTITKLRRIINPALDSVSFDLIRKFARKARDYEKAGNKAGKAVQDAVKKYKPHRSVLQKNCKQLHTFPFTLLSSI